MRATKIVQCDRLIDYLADGPRSIDQIDRMIRQEFVHPHTAPYLIHLIRNVYGTEIVPCYYSYTGGRWVYSLARKPTEMFTYVGRRTVGYRSGLSNLSGILARGVDRWPEEATRTMEARALLDAAGRVLGQM